MQCWYFNYRISLSSHFVIASDNSLLSTAFHAWLLNRISRLLGSLPAVTNEAENWELISYWAMKNTLPPCAHSARLHPQIHMTTLSEAVIFHWCCFPIRNLEIGDKDLAFVGFFDAVVNAGLHGGKKLTAVVKAKSFTAEIWVPEPQSFYCSLYRIQYTPAPTLAYVHLSAHTHTCNQKKVPTHTLPTDTDTFIRLPSFKYTHIQKQW